MSCRPPHRAVRRSGGGCEQCGTERFVAAGVPSVARRRGTLQFEIMLGASTSAIAVPAGHRLVRIADQPELWAPANTMCGAAWPEFMLHDPVADRCWPHLRDDWPSLQLVLVDGEDEIVAAAQAVPLRWDGTDDGLPEGWDAQFERSVSDLLAGVRPDTLGAIQINVAHGRRGRGLSTLMLKALRRLAVDAELRALIACVRSPGKTRYPLMSIDAYASWCRPDGLPVDPWLRVHARAGARLVRASPRSMTIAAPVHYWRDWTGLGFPVSGPYVVEGALAPVEIDLSQDLGTYHDPNVWMVHELDLRTGDPAPGIARTPQGAARALESTPRPDSTP